MKLKTYDNDNIAEFIYTRKFYKSVYDVCAVDLICDSVFTGEKRHSHVKWTIIERLTLTLSHKVMQL